MYPILFTWGSLSLPSWHVLYVAGALAAYVALLRLRKSAGIPISSEDISRIFLVCYISGYFGARLLSVLVEEPQITGFWAYVSALLRFGPMTFYGGAIAAFLVGSLFSLVRRLPYGDTVDLGVVAGLLALSIGRLGCFLNGDDYGIAVTLERGGAFSDLGVIFPVLGDGIPRWPVQLFEAFGVCLIVLGMAVVKVHVKPCPGFVGLLSIVLYANLRFGLEFLRDDFRGFVFGTWLSTSQFIALATLAIAGVIGPFLLSHKSSDT